MGFYCRIIIVGAACLVGGSMSAAQSSTPASPTPTPASSEPSNPPAFPTQSVVERTVAAYLDTLPNREEDDLLSQGDISPLFVRLERLGWRVADQDEIEKRLLNDSDWLVRTLRTRKGTRFMRDMATFPGGYDRLDRMRHQRYGKQELQGLIDSPGGAELIEYLTSTKQGRQTGRHLRSGYGGSAFNQPTDRLYTKADVFKQLQASYAAEVARRAQPTSVLTAQPTPAASGAARGPVAPTTRPPASFVDDEECSECAEERRRSAE